MPLPVRQAYLAIRNGAEPKRYSCVGCGQEYYCFTDPGKDFFGSVAPCPVCGQIQPSMCAAAKAQHPSYFGIVGLILFLVGIIIFGFALLPGLLGMRDREAVVQSNLVLPIVDYILLGGSLALMLFEWIRSRRFDPNAAPAEDRRRLGQEVSLTSKTYNEAQTQAADPTFSSSAGQESPAAATGGSGSSWNADAVFLVIIGVGLTISGIWSLFDPDAKKIYIGAAVVGPILFFRNIGRIRE